jgi:hypothetical protein
VALDAGGIDISFAVAASVAVRHLLRARRGAQLAWGPAREFDRHRAGRDQRRADPLFHHLDRVIATFNVHFGLLMPFTGVHLQPAGLVDASRALAEVQTANGWAE